MLFRYSRWDGSQDVPDPDADDLLEAMSDDIMSDGDLWSAMRRLFQQGAHTQQGQKMPGLQDLVNQLRSVQEQLKARNTALAPRKADAGVADFLAGADEAFGDGGFGGQEGFGDFVWAETAKGF